MPRGRFALEDGGDIRLEINWKMSGRDTCILVDGEEIGSIATKAEFNQGKEFALADGSTLSVRYKPKFMAPGLYLSRNGRPLPRSAGDHAHILQNVSWIIYFIAGFAIVLGLLAEVAGIEFLLGLGFGSFSIIFGVVYGALGCFVQRRSMIALVAAVVLLLWDTVEFMLFMVEQESTPPISGILIRVFLLIAISRGFGAIRAIRSSGEKRTESVDANS